MQEQIIDISKTYTLDEYIKIDETGPDRHEYFDGKLIAMPGESIKHNYTCKRLSVLLDKFLIEKGYSSVIESVK